MNPSNHTFPSEASTFSEPVELTMDAFRPIEPPLQLNMDTVKKPLPYASQNPRSATHVTVKTPAGIYQSDDIRIDEEAGEITIDADGVRVLLDQRNVAVYLEPENPTIYRNVRCDVRFTP